MVLWGIWEAVGYHFGACIKNAQRLSLQGNWLIHLDWIAKNVQILVSDASIGRCILPPNPSERDLDCYVATG